MVKRQFTVGTMHCTLENASDLDVNEHQMTQHYHARSTEKEEEKCQIVGGGLFCAART